MCLIIDGAKTIDFINDNKEFVTVYKVILKNSINNKYKSPFKSVECKIGDWLIANIEIGSKHKYLIEGGAIHCLLTLEDAKKYAKYLLGNKIIVECKAQMKDFIACGTTRIGMFYTEFECDSICFEKVFLEKIIED